MEEGLDANLQICLKSPKNLPEKSEHRRKRPFRQHLPRLGQGCMLLASVLKGADWRVRRRGDTASAIVRAAPWYRRRITSTTASGASRSWTGWTATRSSGATPGSRPTSGRTSSSPPRTPTGHRISSTTRTGASCRRPAGTGSSFRSSRVRSRAGSMSVMQATGGNGEQLVLYAYAPFGEPLGASPARIGFSSELFDAGTRLAYYNYRHLAPWLGRWLGRDAIEEEGGSESICIYQ